MHFFSTVDFFVRSYTIRGEGSEEPQTDFPGSPADGADVSFSVVHKDVRSTFLWSRLVVIEV